ncbi:flagellar biosynthetic protein FlhB [Salmonella enterica subsp. enterica]|uniref:Flagellar biosynthetic protein FlhB n=1 Tax=Salmonella enterica I TaxID=59201 RepID=A0A447PLL5_SALET|nr:flagellar biosynthetic protein FlhB [Salmonella enterica subsp. enterica]
MLRAKFARCQRAAAQRRMMEDVPKADVIVTNPTHYSVALQYDENKMSAPKVVAKGAGLIALRIREIGAEHRVPTLEAPPLARALYRHAKSVSKFPGSYMLPLRKCWPGSGSLNAGGLRAGNVLHNLRTFRCQKRWIL